jgi:MFS family permease
LIGRWSDSVGRRKPFLLAFMVIFSFCSVLSGLAAGFGTLFASRLVMGAVEGPFLPICLAIIAAASVQSRRGLNVGIVQNLFGSLIGTAIAPLVLVALATRGAGAPRSTSPACRAGARAADLAFIAEPPASRRRPITRRRRCCRCACWPTATSRSAR